MIYQVDCSIISSGKKVSATKRRVVWRWGFANEEALEAGKTGVDCRGYEHEVKLVWSIASGKRSIMLDGKEIHYSLGKRAEGKFQFSFNGQRNHIYTIIAYAALPLKSRQGFKQFEMLIDGRSFSSLPRIFELAKGADMQYSYNQRNFALQSAAFVPVSRQESVSSRNSSGSMRENAPQPGRPIEVKQPQDFLSNAMQTEVTQDLLDTSPVLMMDYGNPQVLHQTSASDHDNFNPQQPPSYEDVWSSIMGAYNDNNNGHVSTTVDVNEMHYGMENLQINTAKSLNTVGVIGSEMESPREVSGFEDMLNNLVNIDDISCPVFKNYTPESHQSREKENRTSSLSELKNMHNKESPSPTKEIMKNHSVCQQTNVDALVVYGEPQNNYNTYSFDHQSLHRVW
mmetsp:Transcript_14803/g.16877  ORF Transcript_14803/g.16877 Transcript_14803/m.16877 type:complete len:398 (+) Transcript_14803:120-1313(+)